MNNPTSMPSPVSPTSDTAGTKHHIRMICMGTKGGPSLLSSHCLPQSTALLIDERMYLIDTGYGTSWRMLQNALPLRGVSKIFLTHLHNDHVQDYPAVIMNGWASGLQSQVAVYGPPGTHAMTAGVWQTFGRDIGLRIDDEGKPDPRKLIEVTEISEGVIYQDSLVKVSALIVPHPPFPHGEAFAFRFDIDEVVIVISGDTAFFPPLAEFARGADILVHEAVHVPSVAKHAAKLNKGSKLAQAIISHHTPIEDVGVIAHLAQPKVLVLSHLVPTGVPQQLWIEGVRKAWQGPLIIAEDNMCITPGMTSAPVVAACG